MNNTGRQRGVAKFAYDFAARGGAQGDITLAGTPLPSKAVVYGGVIDVITAPDSAAHTATIAVSVESAGDMVAAVIVSNAQWTAAGIKAIVPVSTAATAVKTTAERTPKITIATQDLTAGKFNVFLHYFLSD